MNVEKSGKDRDYFSDKSVLLDPYEFFEEHYNECPVTRLRARDALFVSGFAETLDVLKNHEDFSSVISVPGAGVTLPFEPHGSDISALLEQFRDAIAPGRSMVTLDGTAHLAARSILNRLFTPSRLKANEEYMERLAQSLVADAVAKGECDLIVDIAVPFVTLVIADLLGVPEEDRDEFRRVLDAAPPPGNMDAEPGMAMMAGPLEFMATFFVRYVEDRRANPRDDVLTELSLAKYPDGTTPGVAEIVGLGTFLFGAGQDTSAKLIGNAMRFLIETPGLQQQLRDDPKLVPAFLEEVLRLEGSSKITSRLAVRDTHICEHAVASGTKVLVGLAAANRDPRRWDDPKAFRLNRPKIKEHLAFGRGPHTCAGAPLARAEVRVLFERLLANTAHIDFSEAEHGPAGARRLDYEPSWIVRGLARLHLTLTALDKPVAAVE